MKTVKSIYSNTIKILFLSIIISVISCSKDDDSVDNSSLGLPSSLVKTYAGVLAYDDSSGDITVANTSGTAAIVSTGGNTYRINFSDNVPSIGDLIFNFNSNTGAYVSAADTNTKDIGITLIEGGSLIIGADINGNEWGFNGK